MLCGLNLEYLFQTGSGGAEFEPSCDVCCCEINGEIWEPMLKKEGSQERGWQGRGLVLIWMGAVRRNSGWYLHFPSCFCKSWLTEDVVRVFYVYTHTDICTCACAHAYSLELVVGH